MARILVIDDNDEFRKMLNRMLTQNGYEVIEASHGKAGLKLYNKDQIDLVITDIFMPEKEGTETVLELKKINPDIKIIVVSGGGAHRQFRYLDNMIEFGAQKVFEKPFDSKEFLASITELLEAE